MRPPPAKTTVRQTRLIAAFVLSATAWATPCLAAPFSFSTGNVTGLIAVATRPDTGAPFEIEAGDDFILGGHTSLTSATFTGLIRATGAAAPSIGDVVVEIYRVFPADSNTARTSGPPTFSTSQVPTRVNSPSDVAFDSRDTADADMTSTTTTLAATFTANTSVLPGGIPHVSIPPPFVPPGGDGAVTGSEVRFNVVFTTPFDLPADHYFFVPQVQVTGGQFLWLSAERPIVTGTPFLPDLQSWTRDTGLDPDWLRVGTDIVGAGTFNQAFTLNGTVPEPSTLLLIAVGALALGWRSRKTTLSAR